MKIRPVEAELLHADGQTDRHHEVNTSFSQFRESALKYKNTYTIKISVMYITLRGFWNRLRCGM